MLIIGVLITTTFTLACSCYVLYQRLEEYRIRPLSYSSDETIIVRSFRATAAFEHAAEEQIRRNSFAVVMHFPDKRCVELRPTLHVLGGGHVYCYENGSDRLIEQFGTGE